jgi:MFS family permease
MAEAGHQGEAATSVEDGSQLSLVEHRSFAQFWLSRVLGSLANQMQTIAVSWQVYEMTGSALDLGLVGLAQFFPLVALMLVAGQVADRYDRKTVICISQVVDGLAMGILALGTAGGWLTRDVILAIVVMFGAARVFQQPTQQSLLPLLVPPALLSRAVAASSSSNQIATIVGPAIGGLLLAVSIPLVYVLCALLYFVAAFLSIMIKVERAARSREPVTFSTFFAGIGFIRRRPVILGSITLDLFAVVLGGATALLPIYVKDIFEGGPADLGLLRLSPAVGALALSILLAHWPIRRHAGATMLATVAVFGLATIVFGLSTSLPVAVVALVVMGAADMVSVVIRMTLVQLGTPNEMRGRVSAVNSLFIGTSNQLGDFRSGVTAEWLGAVPSVLIGGVGTLLVVAGCIALFPQLARIDRMEDIRKDAAG